MSEEEQAPEEEQEEQAPDEGATEAESDEEAPAEEPDAAPDESEEAAPPVAPEDSQPVHELSRPPVIDIEAILTPISGDTPAGEYLRYEGVYDEIGEARRADENLEQGAWQAELKLADYTKVIELANTALVEKSKDLQLAAWLSEALANEHGFAGLRDSLKILRGLISGFWETVFPEIDEGDEEGRANAIAWFDKKGAFIVKKAQILNGEGCSYLGYLDSKKFVIPDNLDVLETNEKAEALALIETAKRENRITDTKWSQAVNLTNRAFCEEVKVAMDECSDELKALDLAIEENFNRNQAPGVREIGKALSEIDTVFSKVLAQKRLEEPDPSDEIEGTEEDGDEGETSSRRSGPVKDREDALRKLSEISAFFKRTEPHSPVAYLVDRAVNWGNMPLENWLQDVIKDENILYQLRQTLGFNTAQAEETPTAEE